MSDELFVVRHYTADDRPEIKGNGLDGITVGQCRDEAEQLVAWVNARISRVRELEEELRIGRQASEIVGTMAMQQKERAERAEAERDAFKRNDDLLTNLTGKIGAERDALRALLLHTAEQIERCGQHPELLASIDAALAGEKP